MKKEKCQSIVEEEWAYCAWCGKELYQEIN